MPLSTLCTCLGPDHRLCISVWFMTVRVFLVLHSLNLKQCNNKIYSHLDTCINNMKQLVLDLGEI